MNSRDTRVSPEKPFQWQDAFYIRFSLFLVIDRIKIWTLTRSIYLKKDETHSKFVANLYDIVCVVDSSLLQDWIPVSIFQF